MSSLHLVVWPLFHAVEQWLVIWSLSISSFIWVFLHTACVLLLSSAVLRGWSIQCLAVLVHQHFFLIQDIPISHLTHLLISNTTVFHAQQWKTKITCFAVPIISEGTVLYRETPFIPGIESTYWGAGQDSQESYFLNHVLNSEFCSCCKILQKKKKTKKHIYMIWNRNVIIVTVKITVLTRSQFLLRIIFIISRDLGVIHHWKNFSGNVKSTSM